MKKLTFFSAALLCVVLMACSNKGKLPFVRTGQYTTYPATKTVQCEGYVETDGGEVVVDRGICYVVGSSNPNVGDHRVSSGSGKGSFTAVLTDINEGEYTYCAYATNSAGTAYGETRTFKMESSSSSGGGGNPDEQKDEYITIAEAINIANALPENTKSNVNYKVKAVISELITNPSLVPGTYTNMHLKLKDATGEINSYYTNYLGNKPFSSADQVPSVGDEVVVEGPLYKYVTATKINPEFYNAWLVSIDRKGGGNEPQGNYLIVNNNITSIATASCSVTYNYAVSPSFFSTVTVRFLDNSGKVVFYIGNNTLSYVTSVPVGTWTYETTWSYDECSYFAWGGAEFGSKNNALTSFVVSKKGNNYIVDCVINSTAKLHYEGFIPMTTSTEYNN